MARGKNARTFSYNFHFATNLTNAFSRETPEKLLMMEK
jgi:hypothetical protein